MVDHYLTQRRAERQTNRGNEEIRIILGELQSRHQIIVTQKHYKNGGKIDEKPFSVGKGATLTDQTNQSRPSVYMEHLVECTHFVATEQFLLEHTGKTIKEQITSHHDHTHGRIFTARSLNIL